MKILKVGLMVLFCFCLIACSTLAHKKAKLNRENSEVIEPLSVPPNLDFASIYSYYPVSASESVQKLKPIDLLPPHIQKNSLPKQ